MSERIEFYKNRSIGERFSVAIDFLKQNWKILYKNILIGGIPLAIIMGYALTQTSNTQLIASNLTNFAIHYALLLLTSFVSSIFMYSMTGAVLSHYDKNQLTEATGWSDLKDTLFKFSGKTTLISLAIYVPILLVVAIFGAFAFVAGDFSGAMGNKIATLLVVAVFILLLLGAIIALAPSFMMLYFPAYFSGKGNIESIKVSFKLGFANWGSLFVAILLAGIILTVVSMVFTTPFQLVTVFTMGRATIFSFILAVFSSIGTILVYPIMIIIFAFQYFSIVEKEEGVSLQSKVDEFENL